MEQIGRVCRRDRGQLIPCGAGDSLHLPDRLWHREQRAGETSIAVTGRFTALDDLASDAVGTGRRAHAGHRVGNQADAAGSCQAPSDLDGLLAEMMTIGDKRDIGVGVQ